MSDLGLRTTRVVGTYESDDFEREVVRDAELLVATPEKLDLIIRSEPGSLGDAALFVLDEVQVLDGGRRGAKLEMLIARLLQALPHARFLVATAVVPQETLQDLATWLRGQPGDVVVQSWRPSTQRYARFRWNGDSGVIEYAPGDVAEIPRAFVPGVITRRTFEYLNPATGRWNRRSFPDRAHRAQVAAELAFRLSAHGSVLVFCAQANFVDSVAAALFERISLARRVDESVPPHFTESPDRRAAHLADEWLGDRAITSWLRTGIGVHYGSLPDGLRLAVESDVRERRLNVLIATNTLAQGVNLPFRTVIVHSSSRYAEDTRTRLPARDYWNIAGRAGRAGEETDGLVVHLVLGQRDEEDFRYYLLHRAEVEPVTSVLLQQCIGLAQRRLSVEAVEGDLDAEIIPLLLEEEDFDADEVVTQLFEKTLAHVQSRRRGIDLAPLRQLVVGRVRRMIDDVSPGRRRIFSATGMSPGSCLSIVAHIHENERDVRSLLANTNVDLEETTTLLLPPILGLAECRPDREFGGSYAELIQPWLRGTELRDILREFGAQARSPEDLGRVIDDIFRYKLPWGVSAYVLLAGHELGVPRNEIVSSARFLSTMIRYGVPDVVACWAMSAGIPFRRVAIRMSLAYAAEGRPASVEEFREWLGSLSTERLHYEFGLRSPLLEDVARMIPVVGSNRSLEEARAPEELLPLEFVVQGVQYEDRVLSALRAEPGDVVAIRRDYDNAVDRNAIAIDLNGQEIGYMPRQIAQILALEIDTGRELVGVVVDSGRETIPTITVRVS